MEFTVVSPLLFMLLFGFSEMGRLLFQQNQLTKQVIAGTRYLARIPNAVNTVACTSGSSWAGATATAQNLIALDLDGNAVLEGLDAEGAIVFSVESVNVGTSACVIRVDVEVSYITLFGDSPVPFLNPGPIILNSSAEERYIGL